MRRLLVLAGLLLAVGTPTAHADPVQVPHVPAYYRDGTLWVRVICPEGCKGDIRADRGRRGFWIDPEDQDAPTDFVPVPASRPGRHVVLRVREGGRVRRMRRPVRRGTDRERCGFRSLAERIDGFGADTLLRVRLDLGGEGEDDFSAIVACHRGSPNWITFESWDLYALDLAEATTMAADWVAVVSKTEGHYGDGSLRLTLGSLRRPSRYASADLGAFYDGRAPIPDRMLLARDGALLLARPGDTGHEVVIVDASGVRVVDPGPDVDPASLAVNGHEASWTSGGARRTTPMRGPLPASTTP